MMRTPEEIIREDEERRAKAGRYLDQTFDQAAFDLEVAKFMADLRVRNAGRRRAWDAATKTLSDVQFDRNTQIEEESGPCPW